MFYKLMISLLVLIIATYSSIASSNIKIIKVCDGDTVKIEQNGNVFNFRLAGIDCYETGKINRAYKQAYLDKITIEEVVKRGKKSKEYLRNKIKSSNHISIKTNKTGRYGRPIGILYVDGININSDLIKNGGCFAYPD